MRRTLLRSTAALVALAALFLGTGTAGARTAAAPYCGIRWGSLEKSAGSGPVAPPSPVTAVRAGRHSCYDRLVIDLPGPSAGYRVSYVAVVPAQATGDPVSLRGGASLDVTVFSPTYDLEGDPTVSFDAAEVVGVGSFRTFRQVASGGSFEGVSTFGLGVRARLPFRVFVLAGPGPGSRIVVDVAHRW